MYYGDGSDGVLNVTSGEYTLNLDTKYQFDSINIAEGATLTTGSTTGAVLYLLCNGTCTIDGTIDVSNKVTYGDNAWSVTIDDEEYTTPGVAAGGDGGFVRGVQNSQNDGFGGGGDGGFNTDETKAGKGGAGSATFGAAGAGVTQISQGTDYEVEKKGGDASGSGGGAGSAYVYLNGSSVWKEVSVSGSGGGSYGANGKDGGTTSLTYVSGTGNTSYIVYSAGGGGAGGRAGRSGVHVVIKARELVLNGQIITSGTDGQKGGNGGRSRSKATGLTDFGGCGGGGGGGGHAGDITLVYSDNLTDTSTKSLIGGNGGGAGQYAANSSIAGGDGGAGTDGSNGSLNIFRVIETGGSVPFSGEATESLETASFSISSGVSFIGRGIYTTSYQALPQKDYEYRVFTSSGEYVGTWQNVSSEFGYTQAINQNASELIVDIARSPDNRVVKLTTLQDESGENITDENGDNLLVQTETANSVGPDTDVVENYNVDVYAFYGGYENLLDQNGDPILDQNSDPILVQYGSPNGKRVYSGYIADYELTFGSQTGVRVTIVPHATEMMHYIFKNGTDTTVPYNSEDPSQMARDAMDDYASQGGVITYDTASIPLSGAVSSYDFKLQTTRETIDRVVELLPAGWYHYPHPGENKQYVLEKGDTADHTFYYEKHITELKLKKSITNLINDVYFVGGDTGTGDLFKHYEDATSQTTYRKGLERLSDSRVTLADSAQILSERDIAEFSEPRYRTSVIITDAVYDIESIKLGQMVGFKNFGSFVDDLILQIVNIVKGKHSVTLDLDMTLPGEAKRLEDLKRNLMSKLVENIADAPA